MQTDWFRGTAITVRYDDEARLVMFVANNGRIPTLTFAAQAFVTASVEDAKLTLTGAFDDSTRIQLKLPPDDALGIVRTLGQFLGLPRLPQPVTLLDLADAPDGSFVVIEGRCFPFANGPVMESRLALVGVSGPIEHNAPYRVTGFYRRGEREELRVLAIQHLNPPVTWFTGETARVTYAPQRELLGFLPMPGHHFALPPGTQELWLPSATLASAIVVRDGLELEGDLTRTGYGTRVTLEPLSANDARAILSLLGERCQLPRVPRSMTPADLATITTPTLVRIDGTFQPGHFEGPNFDGGIQLRDRSNLVDGGRYRVTGFLYPAFRPEGPFIGYTGAHLQPLAVERLR